MTREREDELGIFAAPNCLLMMQWSWWEGAKGIEDSVHLWHKDHIILVGVEAVHPFDQYLVHLIHVLEVDQCLVWASLGVRLPVWVGFVVTAGVLFFFFFSFFFFFLFSEREREIRCDFGLFVNGYGFKFLIICCDFGFFCFWVWGTITN